MPRYGIKVWSKDVLKNPDFFNEAAEAVKNGTFGYIELFAIPDSFNETQSLIAPAIKGLPVAIHAPHSCFGLDTGNPELETSNQKKFEDSRRFADLLNAEIIILHAGAGAGEACLSETIRQFRNIGDSRIAVENLPLICSSTHVRLHGNTPAEIQRIITETGCKFCLDFSHAVCAANSTNADVWQTLNAFAALNPSMYHLCDGNINGTDDEHLHYGEGNYDLKRLLTEYVEPNALVTMETGHEIPQNITPWLEDLRFLQNL